MKKGLALFIALAIVLIFIGALFVYDSYSIDTGTVNIGAADTSLINISAAYLTFETISIESSTSHFFNYSIGNLTVNILGESSANPSHLISLSLSAQTYSTFKIFIKNVTIIFLGKALNLTLTSSFALIQHSLNVTTKSSTNLTLEFDLSSDIDLASLAFIPAATAVIS